MWSQVMHDEGECLHLEHEGVNPQSEQTILSTSDLCVEQWRPTGPLQVSLGFVADLRVAVCLHYCP